MTARIQLTIAPTYRWECLPGGWNARRPCAFKKECRYHLEHDDSKQARGNRGLREATRLAQREADGQTETCSLDLSEREHTQEEVALLLGVSKARVGVVEESAMRKLRRAGVRVEEIREWLAMVSR